MPFVVSDVTGVFQKLDACMPFGLRESDLAGECVEMLDQTGHHRPEPIILATGHGGDDCLCNRVFVDVPHDRVSAITFERIISDN